MTSQFAKNGGGQNAHHNGRNSQVSGDGFKKKGKKKNGIRSCTKSKNTKMKRNPKGT